MIERPEDPTSTIDDVKLDDLDPGELSGLAREFAEAGDWRKAAQCQHYVVRATASGQYDLACYCSRGGLIEAALFSMLEAVEKEGVDATWASLDADLLSIRADSRWPPLHDYLVRSQSWWKDNGRPDVTLLLPEGYSSDRPLPLLVWLHGRGDRPASITENPYYQQVADDLHVAIAGVSGTIPRGPRSYEWSQFRQDNSSHIRRQLRRLVGKVAVQPGRIVPFGFSQGGQVAIDLVADDPDRFAGAIVMSPGGVSFGLSRVSSKPSMRKLAFVCLSGKGEGRDNERQTRQCAEWANAVGARVQLRIDPDQDGHTFPRDFSSKFPEWVRFILDGE